MVARALQSVGVPEAEFVEAENISIGDAERLTEVMRLKALELDPIFGMDRRTPRRIDWVLWVAGRYLLRSEPALRRTSLSPPASLPSLRPLPTMLRPPGTISWAVGSSMSTLANPSSVTDEQVRALLEKYKCPVPFHEVRTRFLGNIASPIVSPAPIKAVQDLWGGKLPPFDTIAEENKLFGALGMGLWIRLSRHQERALPFRLSPLETTPSRASLAELALMRRQELDGFSEGLFGREEIIDLPQRAQRVSTNSGRCARCSKPWRSWLRMKRNWRLTRAWRRRFNICARRRGTRNTKSMPSSWLAPMPEGRCWCGC